MSYSTDVADHLAEQLQRFVTLNRHQLIGQVANLDFWIGEVEHALAVIDGYVERFPRLKAAQDEYVTEHGTFEFCMAHENCDITWKAESPKRIPDHELRASQTRLCKATYQFLVRCCREGFIENTRLFAECEKFDIRVDLTDLRARRS